jgi:hypothetical protein
VANPGWIKLHRRILESDIFAHKPAEWLKVWIYILLKVNFNDGKQLPQGTGYFYRPWEACDVTRNSWHHATHWLQESYRIAIRKAIRGSIIKVLKYKDYQVGNTESSDSKSDIKATPRRYKSDTISKEVKNLRSREKTLKHICVFNYWQKVMEHPNAKPTRERLTKIAARLKEGYSVEDLKKAIDGCLASSHHMGDNDQGKRYDSIGLIFRNGDKVEQFMGYLSTRPKPQEKKDVVNWNTGATNKIERDRQGSVDSERGQERARKAKELIAKLAKDKGV